MTKTSRPMGRFFSVLISLAVMIVSAKAAFAGGAVSGPPPASPAAAWGLMPPKDLAKDGSAEAGPLSRRGIETAARPLSDRGSAAGSLAEPALLLELAQLVTPTMWDRGSLLTRLAVPIAMMGGGNSGPALTQINDTVYRADGTPAQGTVTLVWPAFTTAGGQAVAAGQVSIELGAAGSFSASLAANTGSTPATYYRAVYHLNDGTTATEFWVIPATQTTTISAIRSKLVPTDVAAQFMTRDAADSSYVHASGMQTVNSVLTFAASPAVPTPRNATDTANKAYVDSAAAANLASPPAIGSVSPNAISATALSAQSANVSGALSAGNISSPAAIAAPGSAGNFNIGGDLTLRDVPGVEYMVSKYGSLQLAINAAYNNGAVLGMVVDDRTAPYNGPGFILYDSVALKLAPTTYTITSTVSYNNGNNTVTAGIVSIPGSRLIGSSTSTNHGTVLTAGNGLNADLIATSTVGTGIGSAAQWWHWGGIEDLRIQGNGANQTAGNCLNVENMGETAFLRSIEVSGCHLDNILFTGASATPSDIRNITTKQRRAVRDQLQQSGGDGGRPWTERRFEYDVTDSAQWRPIGHADDCRPEDGRGTERAGPADHHRPDRPEYVAAGALRGGRLHLRPHRRKRHYQDRERLGGDNAIHQLQQLLYSELHVRRQ